MTYTYYDEKLDREIELEISFDWEPGQKSDGLTTEPIESGFDQIYALDENKRDRWSELPESDQKEILRILEQEQDDDFCEPADDEFDEHAEIRQI